MSVNERDPYTGHMITGHVWNGIKELNSPVPLLWYACFLLALVFSIGYWIYMPAWPLLRTHTQGLSGFDQRDELARQVEEASLATDLWREKLVSQPLADSAADKDLMALVLRAGPALYEDNCAGCHGEAGEGARYFPRLNDAAWLWGESPDGIYKTLQFGINSGHAQSRIAQMPAFGESGLLDASQIRDVSLYLLSLSSSVGDGSRSSELKSVHKGEGIFKSQCIACHGANAKGNTMLGAPNLVDAEWMYGARLQDLNETIMSGRAGYMPAWTNRIDDEKLRILALYIPTLAQSASGSESTESE